MYTTLPQRVKAGAPAKVALGRPIKAAAVKTSQNQWRFDELKKLQQLKPLVFAGVAGLIAAEPANAGLLTLNYTLPVVWVAFTIYMYWLDKTVLTPGIAFIQENDMMIRKKIAEYEAEVARAEAEYQAELARQEEALKKQKQRMREEEARLKAERAKELEEEKRKLYKELRDAQFKLHDLYEELRQEVKPAVAELRENILEQVDKYNDVDANIEAIPDDLDVAMGFV